MFRGFNTLKLRCFRFFFSLGPVLRYPVAKHRTHALHHQRYTIEYPIVQSCPRVVILLLWKRWNVANAFAPPAFQSCAVLPFAKLVQVGQFPADSSLSGARIFNLDFTFRVVPEKWCSWNNGHVPTAHFLSLRSINDPPYTTLSLSLSFSRVGARVGTFNPANNINYAAPSIIQSFVLKLQTALPFPNVCA